MSQLRNSTEAPFIAAPRVALAVLGVTPVGGCLRTQFVIVLIPKRSVPPWQALFWSFGFALGASQPLATGTRA